MVRYDAIRYKKLTSSPGKQMQVLVTHPTHRHAPHTRGDCVTSSHDNAQEARGWWWGCGGYDAEGGRRPTLQTG